jgi:hypothetical protein
LFYFSHIRMFIRSALCVILWPTSRHTTSSRRFARNRPTILYSEVLPKIDFRHILWSENPYKHNANRNKDWNKHMIYMGCMRTGNKWVLLIWRMLHYLSMGNYFPSSSSVAFSIEGALVYFQSSGSVALSIQKHLFNSLPKAV